MAWTSKSVTTVARRHRIFAFLRIQAMISAGRKWVHTATSGWYSCISLANGRVLSFSKANFVGRFFQGLSRLS